MRVRPEANWPAGEVRRLSHSSDLLKDNPWHDPHVRDLHVYLPPGYQAGGPAHIALWDLAAFTNSGPGHVAWRHHGETLPQRLDRLIADGALPPVVVVMPDCYTSLGGNQYLDSPAVGPYASYIVEELIPFVGERFNVGADPRYRGVFGKSSGGYGAITLAMDHPGTFGALASHAGDVGFELVYRPEFPVAASHLQLFDGDVYQFLQRFWRNPNRGRGDYATLMTVAMAASYDPDPEQPDLIRLPFRLEDCSLLESRWKRWLDHDPLHRVAAAADALRALNYLHIDAGNRDQYNIQFGTRSLSKKLEKLGVCHHYEEFEGTHSGLDTRLDISLPAMVAALQKSH